MLAEENRINEYENHKDFIRWVGTSEHPGNAQDSAMPIYFKGDRIEIKNQYGAFYKATVIKPETRWSDDRKPYVYYRVLPDGETTTNIIPCSMVYAAIASSTTKGA